MHSAKELAKRPTGTSLSRAGTEDTRQGGSLCRESQVTLGKVFVTWHRDGGFFLPVSDNKYSAKYCRVSEINTRQWSRCWCTVRRDFFIECHTRQKICQMFLAKQLCPVANDANELWHFYAFCLFWNRINREIKASCVVGDRSGNPILPAFSGRHETKAKRCIRSVRMWFVKLFGIQSQNNRRGLDEHCVCFACWERWCG